MVNKSLSVSSTPVQTVEELYDALSALPPLVHCRKCGSRLRQMNATFFSCGGKMWKLPLPVCTKCEPTQFSRERADPSNRAVGAAIFSAARSRSRPPRAQQGGYQIHGVEVILIRLSHRVRQRPRENPAGILSSTDFRGFPRSYVSNCPTKRVVVPCRYALR